MLHASIVSYLAALELDMSQFSPTLLENFNSKAYCRAKAEKLCEKLIASSQIDASPVQMPYEIEAYTGTFFDERAR